MKFLEILEKIFSPSPKKGRTFIIGAKRVTTKAAGELFPSLVLKKSGGIFSSDKDDILLGNHPREVARQLIKQGFRLGNSSVCHPIWGWITSVEGDRFDYHHSFKRAQIADPEYGFRHGEVSDLMGNVENAMYLDLDQPDLFEQPSKRKDPKSSDDKNENSKYLTI